MLTSQGVTRANIYNPPVNDPPVITSTPTPSFTEGTADTYDMTQNFTDDGVSVVITSLINILPNGLAYNGNTHILTYDGIGVASISSHQLVVDDQVNTPVQSAAFNINIQSVGFHEDILNEISGFAKAQGVTGGAGFPLVTVTNLDSSGTGSLREAIDAGGNKWIRFTKDLSGTINLGGEINLDSDNVTIDGRGANVTVLRSSGIRVFDVIADNIIIMYITVDSGDGPNDDAIVVETTARGMWFHQMNFRGNGDDQLSFRNGGGSTLVDATVSRCSFAEGSITGPVIVGSQPSTAGVKMRVTIEHCEFDSGGRQPNPRYCLLDFVNNYCHDWTNNPAQTTTFDAEVRIRNNYLDAGGNTMFSGITGGFTAFVFEEGNVFVDGAFVRDTTAESNVFDPDTFYVYTLVVAGTAMRDDIIANSGFQLIPFPGD